MFGKKSVKVELAAVDAKRVITVLEALGFRCDILSFDDAQVWAVKVHGVEPETLALFLENFKLKGGGSESEEEDE